MGGSERPPIPPTLATAPAEPWRCSLIRQAPERQRVAPGGGGGGVPGGGGGTFGGNGVGGCDDDMPDGGTPAIGTRWPLAYMHWTYVMS